MRTLECVLAVLWLMSQARIGAGDAMDAARMPLYAGGTEGGFSYLQSPFNNKGLAFTPKEREALDLRGFLPAATIPLAVQVDTALEQIRQRSTPFDRYLYLESIRDTSLLLFYALLTRHTEELLPIAYTPTVGEACQKLSKIYRPTPKGLYLNIKDKGSLRTILEQWPYRDVKVIVFTDGERILGLGDLGANGMGIPLGKIALYTAMGGVPPEQCLGVTLDVGTNTESIIKDPAYIGLKQPRVRGDEYDKFIEEFMLAAQEVFGPNVLLQFEDFANVNCFRLLEQWADRACAFNDDIQGTAAVVLAGVQASRRITGRELKDEKLLLLGAGSAAIGVADLLSYAIAHETGVSIEEARKRIWLMDSKGLVRRGREHLTKEKERYAHEHEDVKELVDAVKALRPTGIIGISTIRGAFNEQVLKAMGEINDRPLIFPLSNPTSKSECTFEEAMRATGNRCVFASGSPFDPITVDGKTYIPGQANNAYIFPGLGLAVLASGITRITMEDIYIAATTLAQAVPDDRIDKGCLYPALSQVRDASVEIAAAISKHAHETGRLDGPHHEDFHAHCRSIMYDPWDSDSQMRCRM